MHKFQTPVLSKMLLVFLGLTVIVPIVSAQIQAKELFRFAEPSARFVAEKPQTEKLSIAAVREQAIDLRITGKEIKELDEFNFPLLGGENYKAVRDLNEGLIVRSASDVTWRGKLEAFPDSSLTLTFKHNVLSGLIYAPTGVYEIVPQASGKHVLVQIDQSLFPECVDDDFSSVNSSTEVFNYPLMKTKRFDLFDSNPADPALDAADSGDRIDVLVLYTRAVKNMLGGAAQAEAVAQQAIVDSNSAYRNSRVRLRVRLAGTAELNFTESGALQTDLVALRDNPQAAALRDQTKADLVALITNSGDGCGVGYVMTDVNTAFAPKGYSISVRSCAIGNLSFAHELGHNFGLAHNTESSRNGSAFPYAFGHYVNGSFSTVMSYSSSCPQGCPRVPYFSNPQVFYNNQPTGITDARDNARALNNTAETVANFRYSGGSLTLLAPNGGESWSRNLPRRVRWSSDNLDGEVRIELSREGGENYETLIAATANDGEEVISLKGRFTRQARVRISSLSNSSVTDSSVATFSIK
ncbi:MAG TPA: M12 family metallo-peptidase [Pyrinomonadaceae bacterium]|jgi:hypothetical protein